MSHQRIIGLYEDNAAEWDRQRGRDLFERPWLETFLSHLPASPRILDLGCGMAEPIAAFLIERGARMTGVDSSPSLIGMCRTRFPSHRWLVGDMRDFSLDASPFDGVLAWHSFFHLSPEDQVPMFARFAHLCAPGGTLMFTSGFQHGEAIGSWQGEPLYHGSLDTDEYQQLLSSNGFKVLLHRVQDPECGHATVWLCQKQVGAL